MFSLNVVVIRESVYSILELLKHQAIAIVTYTGMLHLIYLENWKRHFSYSLPVPLQRTQKKPFCLFCFSHLGSLSIEKSYIIITLCITLWTSSLCKNPYFIFGKKFFWNIEFGRKSEKGSRKPSTQHGQFTLKTDIWFGQQRNP